MAPRDDLSKALGLDPEIDLKLLMKSDREIYLESQESELRNYERKARRRARRAINRLGPQNEQQVLERPVDISTGKGDGQPYVNK